MGSLDTTGHSRNYTGASSWDIIPYLSNDSEAVLRHIEALGGFKEIPGWCEALLKYIQEISSELEPLEKRLGKEHFLDQKNEDRMGLLRIQRVLRKQEYKILARFLEREITDGILTSVLQVTPALLRYSPRIIFSIDGESPQEFFISGALSEDYAPLRIPLPEYMGASDGRIHYSIHVTDTDEDGNPRNRIIEEGYFQISAAPAIQRKAQEQVNGIL